MSISVNVHPVLVVDYQKFDDTWSFRVLPATASETGERREMDVGDEPLLEAEGATRLEEAAALAIELIREHLGEGMIAEAVHRVDGSADAFDGQFADSFDLAIGSPRLVDNLAVEVEHASDDSS